MATFNHKGFSIDVTSEGRFVSEVFDVKVNSDSLAGAKKEIDGLATEVKQEVKLPVVFIRQKEGTRWDQEAESAEVRRSFVTGINRTTNELAITLTKGYEASMILADTEANWEMLNEYLKLKLAYDKISAAIGDRALRSKTYGRMNISDYPKALAELTERHHKFSLEPHPTNKKKD